MKTFFIMEKKAMVRLPDTFMLSQYKLVEYHDVKNINLYKL